ncbi:MAG TPA: leucyl aminopeptidase [Hyphomicrobiaceae bacterium]|nr:leucyl aminopeptidase [Hyphomicrobiaceae bacterium]
MARRLEISFVSLDSPTETTVVLLAADGPEFGPVARRLDQSAGGALVKAAGAADFSGKAKASIEVLAPAGLGARRVVMLGIGEGGKGTDLERQGLGGVLLSSVHGRRMIAASVIVDLKGEAATLWAADLAMGALLRSYSFDRYKSKREEGSSIERLVVHCDQPERAEEEFARRQAVAKGVFLARDLVNEPANVLGPVEFAERANELADTGLEVEVLDVPALEALKMAALLGVAQGSVRPARVVVLQWAGAKSKRARPIGLIGKGVVFDTGGISIKPAGGMEDMKGDMAGAAAVTGAMLALAARKAHVNAVGIIGLVENMPSGCAQRPGDIVRSMSGQTIEVINTDAEGRLVLADLLWYAQERFKPRFMIDLATLTGAIMVALGKDFAGLFSNDDKLAAEIARAGEATGERVWRMPLDRSYERLIESKTADMKNIGGRHGGACAAAQFLGRFVKDTPWAHLDIAGTAMDSSRTDLNQGWASGWGVRLLDRLIADAHEK